MNSFFKGWYFKAQNSSQIVALIPAMHLEKGHKKAFSIQIITESGAWCTFFPYTQTICRENRPEAKIGENVFCEYGLKINIKTDDVTARGDLIFGRLSPLSYDIMGPFRYMPFMECRHSICSMTHTVAGCLYINQKEYRFHNDAGYIEGDRGRSFPNVYAWTQCNFFEDTPNSLMLSIAEIPLGLMRFTGIIGVVLWHGKEYRIASYLGAKVVHREGKKLVVRQGGLQFTAELIKKQDKMLFAPVCGDMKRVIRESLPCTAYYLFEENGKKQFEFKSDWAAFEYEYDN